jgi:hypothetical protein
LRASHRAPVQLIRTSPALRAQALAILAVLQIGVAAALSTPNAVPAAAAGAGASVAYAERPVSGALLGAGQAVRGTAPSARAGKKPTARPATSAAAKPAAKAAAPAAGKRYIPTGTGMWTYMWSQTEGGNAKKVVARAKANGLTHLYVRTGTRQGGFDGGPVLKKLLPATKGTDIRIVAWDFPQLANPVRDARRLAAAAKFRVKGAPRVAAVAPDIETGSEGTRLTRANVTRYMSTLRRLLPKDVSIIGVVPWPSEKRMGHYPYGRVAAYSDAIAPMAYWVNRDPATVARQTMIRLRTFKKPVVPIGQAYDPRIDVPSLRWGSPTQRQVQAFLTTARRNGAPGASLWVWQFANRAHWNALRSAKPLYRAG